MYFILFKGGIKHATVRYGTRKQVRQDRKKGKARKQVKQARKKTRHVKK